MTKEGNKILNFTKSRVRKQLSNKSDPKAIQRLTAARKYLEELSTAD